MEARNTVKAAIASAEKVDLAMADLEAARKERAPKEALAILEKRVVEAIALTVQLLNAAKHQAGIQ